MENNLGFKDLYDVTLKATYNIEIGKRTLGQGEIVAIFDRIQLAQFNEIKSYITANGGFNNGTKIIWNDTKELKLAFSQGVFSKSQLALLTNSKLIEFPEKSHLLIHNREDINFMVESPIVLKHSPQQNIFVYDAESGDKLIEKNDYFIEGNQLKILKEDVDHIIIDYEYEYQSKYSYQIFRIGSNLTDGYLSFTAKTRIKDDVTGQVKTGIIYIPKLKLMSDLSMALGDNAAPQLGKFEAVAIPVGNKGNQVVMEFIMLDQDIDSDIL